MNKKWLILGMIGIAGMANADLIPVQDLGGVPLSNYVDTSNVPNAQAMQAVFENQKTALQVNTINTNSMMLPSPQTEFTPGEIKAYQSKANFPGAFFLIGGDKASIRWVLHNKNTIKSLHAQGFIIDVDSIDQIKFAEGLTDLNLTPINVNGLSSVLGTNHYPLLYNNGWVSQ